MRRLLILLFAPCLSFAQGSFVKKIDTLYMNMDGVMIMLPPSAKNVVAYPGSDDYGAAVKGGSTVLVRPAIENAKPARLSIGYNNDNNAMVIWTWMVYRNYVPEDQMYINLKDVEVVSKPDSSGIREGFDPIEVQFMKKNINVLAAKENERFNGIAHRVENVWVKLSDLMQDDRFYYLKMGVINYGKKVYEIGTVDFFYRNGSDLVESHQEMDQAKPKNTKIPSDAGESIIFVVPKFNLGKGWVLAVTLSEKNGSREHKIKIKKSLLEDAEAFKTGE